MGHADPIWTNSDADKHQLVICHEISEVLLRYEIRWPAVDGAQAQFQPRTVKNQRGWRVVVSIELLPGGGIAVMDVHTFHASRQPRECWGKIEDDELESPTVGKPARLERHIPQSELLTHAKTHWARNAPAPSVSRGVGALTDDFLIGLARDCQEAERDGKPWALEVAEKQNASKHTIYGWIKQARSRTLVKESDGRRGAPVLTDNALAIELAALGAGQEQLSSNALVRLEHGGAAELRKSQANYWLEVRPSDPDEAAAYFEQLADETRIERDRRQAAREANDSFTWHSEESWQETTNVKETPTTGQED